MWGAPLLGGRLLAEAGLTGSSRTGVTGRSLRVAESTSVLLVRVLLVFRDPADRVLCGRLDAL